MFPLWQAPRPAALARRDAPWFLFAAALLVSFGHAAARERGAAIALAVAIVVSIAVVLKRRRPVRAGSLLLQGATLRRVEDKHEGDIQGELLLSRGELLGISLLADRAPGIALLVLTTPSRVRVLPVSVRNRDELAELASLLPPVRTDARRMGAPSASLRAKDALILLGDLLREFPHAAERLYMRGARGESIALDRTELRIGQSRVQLEEPFDYRTFAFFESTGRVVSAYQGAWIKQVQDTSIPWRDEIAREPYECVFVAAMPGEGERPWPILEPAETAVLLRAPRHAVDSLLFPSLHRKIVSHAGARRPPESRRQPATGKYQGRNA